MITKVISGGQTGADQGGWRAARSAGIPTGGWMPLRFQTESGDGRGFEEHPEFLEEFGASEHPSPYYQPRTFANAHEADATLWFGHTSTSGFGLTSKACRTYSRPIAVVTGFSPRAIAAWLEHSDVKTLNVAGNRESGNPGIAARTTEFLTQVFSIMKGQA